MSGNYVHFELVVGNPYARFAQKALCAWKVAIVEERNSRAGSGGLSPERGGILGSVIWTLVLSTSMKYIRCYMVPEVDC